ARGRSNQFHSAFACGRAASPGRLAVRPEFAAATTARGRPNQFHSAFACGRAASPGRLAVRWRSAAPAGGVHAGLEAEDSRNAVADREGAYTAGERRPG